jgi:tetratricopeptide (TPR) repeat protein
VSPQGAVFLSYASQDAEAAKRICEALRAAGIEVWFDQSELRGGDAWDAMIRGQIKECALFMPLISANTNARLEGYFRREWKKAVERTHDMDDGLPFLVPVVIDAISDAEARVPEKFREMQWTRLTGGAAPPAFVERVKKLLGGSEVTAKRTLPGIVGSIARASPGGVAAGAQGKAHRPWFLPVILGLFLILLISIVVRPRRSPKEVADLLAIAQKFTVPDSETPSLDQQLVAKAWEQMNKVEMGPEQLELADGYCRRATELDPADADAWAALSQVNSWYVATDFDRNAARREAARSSAARAIGLAPKSYEARLAQACYLVRGDPPDSHAVPAFGPEADRLLRQLLLEKPDEPRALLAFGTLQRNLGHVADARDAFSRLAGNPAFAALAWSRLVAVEVMLGSWSAAEAAAQRSVAIQPYWENLVSKAITAVYYRGDLASAKAAMDDMPASVIQTDYGVSMASWVFYLRREPDNMLRFLQGVPRDWIHSAIYDGPTAYLIGEAQKMAGRNDAARIEWQAALQLVEHRLTEEPTSAPLLGCKGELLTCLGNFPDAEKNLQLEADVSGTQDWDNLLALRIAQGRMDAAMDIMEKEISRSQFATPADLRLEPDYDPLRDNPRFKALLARLDADPGKSPTAPRPVGGDVPAGAQR